jgi:hypothetical protein
MKQHLADGALCGAVRPQSGREVNLSPLRLCAGRQAGRQQCTRCNSKCRRCVLPHPLLSTACAFLCEPDTMINRAAGMEIAHSREEATMAVCKMT